MPDSATIDATVVHKIAHLARLSITDQEEKKYAQQLTNIFHLIAELESVDTEQVPPLYSAHAQTLRTREDAVTETPVDEQEQLRLRDELLANAPAKEMGLFLVPLVITTAG
jgi:aspartyl-tRNA(Asn)/glutamyl-tRNA(Gln) amidotransferase subunit C